MKQGYQNIHNYAFSILNYSIGKKRKGRYGLYFGKTILAAYNITSRGFNKRVTVRFRNEKLKIRWNVFRIDKRFEIIRNAKVWFRVSEKNYLNVRLNNTEFRIKKATRKDPFVILYRNQIEPLIKGRMEIRAEGSRVSICHMAPDLDENLLQALTAVCFLELISGIEL